MPQDFQDIYVLVVEDNKINQLLVKNMLKKFGILHLDSVDNGNAALKKIAEKKYDVILMDIQMPELDGYQITRLIRKNAGTPNRNIPIIALTGDSLDGERKKADEAGMNAYLVKPFTTEELLTTMLKCLDIPVTSLNNKGKIIDIKSKPLPRVKSQDKSIDLRFLDKFTGGDQVLTAQLIETFLRDVPEAIENLERFIPQKNWKDVHAVAHKIKSCVAIFELNDLKTNIAHIESLAKSAIETDAIPTLFIDFKDGCQDAIYRLEDALRKLNSE